LSNLCPGFKYSISYSSFCAVPFLERCTVAIWTTETGIGGEHYALTVPESGWLTSSDLEFTAASSTSTLYVHVGTVADAQGVGNIYLDDFSIALSGSKDIVQEKVML
jgi:hypothetical protein